MKNKSGDKKVMKHIWNYLGSTTKDGKFYFKYQCRKCNYISLDKKYENSCKEIQDNQKIIKEVRCDEKQKIINNSYP